MDRPLRAAFGPLAAVAWGLTCLAWFDVTEPRPAWLRVLPVAGLWAFTLTGVCAWAWHVGDRLRAGGDAAKTPRVLDPGLGLVLLATLLFRLPLAWQGSAGYVTPDGALSGIVALHIGNATEHLVFVPSVAYSGSLKSHVAALLAVLVDPSRAFCLASVFFYAAFAASVYRLGRLARPERPWVAVAAGLYVSFAPAFITRYSLSNDGNYVEVLALGTWALVLAVLFVQRPSARAACAWAMGVLLGLAFWSHVLALFAMLSAASALIVLAPPAAVLGLVRVAGGFLIGWLPALLWNAANGWETLSYLTPGGAPGAADGPGAGGRLLGLLRDHSLVLLGYDPGYGPVVDRLLVAGAAVAAGAMAFALWRGAREAATGLRRAAEARGHGAVAVVLVLFVAVNVVVAVAALPYLPGNPRYVQFTIGPLAVLLALALEGRRAGHVLFAGLVVFGALGSLAQAPGAFRADAQWRGFVADLEAAGVRHCHTDFFIATKINFLSSERVVCSAKLGPTTTEYFPAYRTAVEQAPAPALIAVNETNAEKLERRLVRSGVAYERRDFMKPVLLPQGRRVDPSDLFPDRDFAPR